MKTTLNMISIFYTEKVCPSGSYGDYQAATACDGPTVFYILYDISSRINYLCLKPNFRFALP